MDRARDLHASGPFDPWLGLSGPLIKPSLDSTFTIIFNGLVVFWNFGETNLGQSQAGRPRVGRSARACAHFGRLFTCFYLQTQLIQNLWNL